MPQNNGLCETCQWVRLIRSDRGSEFLLCRYASEDPRYPKYPRLPVLVCAAFREAAAS
ncbi:MAG: hypothetical protein K2X03_31490 [Bryobacteraceae bacterium]|nr:hypothetical protein [Bryobacteraceae bacterium]